MNKNIKLVLATLGLVLGAGCVEAGTWVNGVYINGPLCTVCDGMRVVQHAYGTAVCTHCDGTGIEPSPETYVETVVVDRWCPPPRLRRGITVRTVITRHRLRRVTRPVRLRTAGIPPRVLPAGRLAAAEPPVMGEVPALADGDTSWRVRAEYR